MNPALARLQPYPFEKLAALTKGASQHELAPISWSVGEPRHPPPPFLQNVLVEQSSGYSRYPATAGLPILKKAIAGWITRRFLGGLAAQIDAERHILPVNGTREALFSAVQALYDPAKPAQEIWLPNPFYQIYEGAALLAGAKIRYLNCSPEHQYQPDFRQISDDDWSRCQLLFICTPGNPSGATLPISELDWLLNKAEEHDFVVLSDECYSELYRDENNPPAGLLQAAGYRDQGFARALAFHSLSKRSNLPGLRSGFVAGDAERIKQFLRYRTYHGSAMPPPHQHISVAAWQDEAHVTANRRLYNEKFAAVARELGHRMPVHIPEASFYLWPNLEEDDEEVALRWLREANIRVLPGQYLSRQVDGKNPGYGHIRIALVSTLEECLQACARLKRIL